MKEKNRKIVLAALGIVLAAVSSGFQTGAAESQIQWMDQSKMTVTADYQSGNEPEKAIDGNASTIWHTSWSARKELPQSITLTFQDLADGVYQLRYTPREDKDWNGTILEYKISISTDGENFTEVAEGVWENTKTEKTATFDARNQVKAVRLTAIATKGNKEAEDSMYASAAEINLVRNPDFKRSQGELEGLMEKGQEKINKNPDLAHSSLRKKLSEGQQILENPLSVEEAYTSVIESLHEMLDEKDSISGYEGKAMYDTNGEIIQAHGGQITKWGDTYYWYGEDKTDGFKPRGVHLYTSRDLYNWEDQGIVMKTMKNIEEIETDTYFQELYGDLGEEEKKEVFKHLDYNSAVLERPKVLYNEKTQKYVLWVHADGPEPGSSGSYAKAMAGVAIADSPQGPFRFLKASRLHTSESYTGEEKGMARDMNLFQDEDGSAYIIYASEENATLYISRLSEDYTDLAVRENAAENVDFTSNMKNASREAPAMFKYKEKYYLMTSGCTGWDPNAAIYYTSDSPLGPWRDMGNPCKGEEKETTFRTQSTCIFPVDAKNGKFVYMGDRWKRENLADSRYVWLPVEFGYDFAMSISGVSDWTTEDLSGKSGYTVEKEEIPCQRMVMGEELDLEKYKNRESYVRMGDGSRVSVYAEWMLEEGLHSQAVGFDTLKGKMTGIEDTQFQLETEYTVNWYQGNTLYFVDCNGSDAGYYGGFKEKEVDLINTVADQEFDGVWGRTEKTGLRNGTGIFESGCWAYEGESIIYRFTLPAGSYRVFAGFQEWWTASRQAVLNVKLVKNTGEEESAESLAEAVSMNTTEKDKNSIFESGFLLETDSLVEISVDKVSGGDPLLSWLSIVQETDSGKLESVIRDTQKRLESLDLTQYSKTMYEALLQTVEQARDYLQKEQGLQKEYDRLEQQILSQYGELEKSKIPETEETEPETEESGQETEETESETKETEPETEETESGPKETESGPKETEPGNQETKPEVPVSLKKPKLTVKSIKKKSIKIQIKKVAHAKGYEIRLSKDKKMKKGVKIYRVNKVTKTITRLQRGKIYYVKSRAFTKSKKGTVMYGPYSSTKKIKVK